MIRNSLAIPTEAPVMILPGAVLFPYSLLPLRIFEPRYRAMLQWALEHDRMFCVAQMKPGVTDAETDDDFFHVAGIGLISASVTQPDGTSNLMLQGLERVRFHGFRQSAPFRIAEIEPLPAIVSEPEKTATLTSTIRKQCSAIRVKDTPLPESFSEALGRITEADVFADTVAQSLVTDTTARQALLEEEDATARLRKLSRLLREQFHVG